ncbi:TetR/AcrR family transcriptional regulator [Qaidamihabitans albus]|uniref:TetR/AcrR family transcriptional regulator n=1 Tax=Qaidamihabitans albus TaxID=2795733 RepID=UPI0027DB9613|nr:TetR/AcrR family transcriptional regulator [Qaidamihabitans albus]
MNESKPFRGGGRDGRSNGVPGSVWLRESRAYRDAPLTRDRIVEAAVALLDAEGAGRLTMRRLAEHLGAGPTTLYWHVRTKDDVVDLALDAIFAEVEMPTAEAGQGQWWAEIRALITGWREAMLRHPWSAALIGRPMLGPNVLRRTEFLHAALTRAGFTGTDLVAAAHALANYVVGSALTEASWRQIGAPGARDAADEHIRERAGDYPTLAANLGPEDEDATFARGLDLLMTGLEATRGSAGSTPPRAGY